MRRTYGAIIATLLAVSIALTSQAVGSTATRSCSKTYTRHMFDRAARATYRGTRLPRVGAYQSLWREARCSRPPATERQDRADWRIQHDAWASRRHPPLPYGSWTIPAAIVMCESGGQNLAPNSASASGYYQIISSTWAAYGGDAYASQAYLASKAEQDVVAARIYAGGAGASQWVCRA